MYPKRKQSTSWQPVQKWYKDITKDRGHYYHQHVVIPGVTRLLNLKSSDSVLDLACGSGVLGRAISKNSIYTGVDISKGLIDDAERQDKNSQHTYVVGDITKKLENLPQLKTKTFSRVTCVLALQNVEHYQGVFDNMSRHLAIHGVGIIVINHPSFRIPRQTSWGTDEQNKLQYRKVNRYLSPLKIPITMMPGQGQRSPITWSFHEPLSAYINGLSAVGLLTSHIEEWSSDKESEGKFGKMENRARGEIPLFMAIVVKKLE